MALAPDPTSRTRAPDLIVEKVEVLDGTRTRDKRKAAVRIEDLTGLLQLVSKLQSGAAVGANPTKAEYDALVNDVAKLHDQLQIVASALQRRLNPQ